MRYFKDNQGEVFAFNEQDIIDGIVILDGLVEMTQEEIDAILNPQMTSERLSFLVSSTIQEMLDDTARKLRYDNMMSVRSYAGYPNPFQQEAIALATWCADCWAKAGQIEQEVIDGIRSMPTSVDEIIREMPPCPITI